VGVESAGGGDGMGKGEGGREKVARRWEYKSAEEGKWREMGKRRDHMKNGKVIEWEW